MKPSQVYGVTVTASSMHSGISLIVALIRLFDALNAWVIDAWVNLNLYKL